MVNKCILCDEEIKTTFLDKSEGTIIKIKKQDKNEFYPVCKNCQKKHKNNLKQEVEKLFLSQ